jgi:triacylglycerol lipase
MPRVTPAAFMLASLVAFSWGPAPPTVDPADSQAVVLLHGLARSASSMDQMAQALGQHGYHVCNLAYPSREHPIADLAARFVMPAIERCVGDPRRPLHFVTHSMGGIIVRQLAREGAIANLGRVVMLGPPNHGSEVVDTLGNWGLFEAINGPAGRELGTSEASSPRQLGAATFEVGVIAGARSINWINSLMIPGDDDGKVSLESAKREGMRDYLVVRVSHPFLMEDDEVIEQTLHFLQSGCFAHERPRPDAPPCVPSP